MVIYKNNKINFKNIFQKNEGGSTKYDLKININYQIIKYFKSALTLNLIRKTKLY